MKNKATSTALLILGKCTLAVWLLSVPRGAQPKWQVNRWDQRGGSWALGSGQVCREGAGSWETMREILPVFGEN